MEEVDRLVKAYIKIRDKKREATAAYEKQDAEYQEMLDTVEGELLEILKATGGTSISTEHGTVIRKVSKRYWTNDWYSFYEFVKKHSAFELFEKRIAQTNMATFLEENPDELPPGLNIDSKYTAVVRRKS